MCFRITFVSYYLFLTFTLFILFHLFILFIICFFVYLLYFFCFCIITSRLLFIFPTLLLFSNLNLFTELTLNSIPYLPSERDMSFGSRVRRSSKCWKRYTIRWVVKRKCATAKTRKYRTTLVRLNKIFLQVLTRNRNKTP